MMSDKLTPEFGDTQEISQSDDDSSGEMFYKGPDGYPILEAEADFKALCGHRLPTFPVTIIKVMIQIQTGELMGGDFVINKFLQAQPTVGHIEGVEDIINRRISELLRANNSGEERSAAMRRELDALQAVIGQVMAFRHKVCGL